RKWIENRIANEHINYFEFDEFEKCDKIGSSAFATVYRLKLMRKVDIYPNIIHFFDKIDTKSTGYTFVLEYANGGTLRNFLEENANNLDWNIKNRLAIELVDS
ncbi:26272_t:CDS:2, partial [Racocetra persica]